ncbi:hypothetical protein ACH5RR_019689 [Cinchona calisaya]|uniref:Uncharacterized protein n=1 Tax=Cinchona calisaya TaxID=153742 RepID=A0ABD2ZQ23_9GENT
MGTHSSIFLIVLLSSISAGYPFATENRKELRTKEVKGHHISQIGRPRVFLYRSFLSEEECDHLIYWVQGKKSDAVADGDSKKVETVNLPTKSASVITLHDEVVARIEERISAWTFIPKENGRPLQVLHFDRKNLNRIMITLVRNSRHYPMNL